MPKAHWRLLFAPFVLTLLFAWASVVSAAPANIAIVLSDDSAPYQETANTIRAFVEQGAARAMVSIYSPAGKKPDFVRERQDLIVLVDLLRRDLPGDDLAEDAVGVGWHRRCRFQVGIGRRSFSASQPRTTR